MRSESVVVGVGAEERGGELFEPSDPRGAVALISNVGSTGSTILVTGLARRLAAAGYAALVMAAPDREVLDAARIADDFEASVAAMALLEKRFGLAACVFGDGLGALAALRLAFEGLTHGAILFGLDPLLERTMTSAWSAESASYALEDRVIPGDEDALPAIADTLAGAEGRRSTVPLLIVSELESMPHLDTQWCADPALPHEIIALAADGDLTGAKPSTAWSSTKLPSRVQRWLDELTARSLTSEPRVDGRLCAASPPPADQRGRVFISYTHRDGADRAEHIKRHLDAAGIRNFRDKYDLGVGDISGIIEDSLRLDCAGGVLVATPGLEHSTFVRNEELPRLLTAARRQDKALEIDNEFTLAGSDTMDPDGPDKVTRLPEGTLRRLTQFDLTQPEDMRGFLRGWLKRKLSGLQGEPISIDIQSYEVSQDVDGNKRADLRVRGRVQLERTIGEAPSPNTDLDAVALAFPLISEALHAAAPSRVTITGGGHNPIGLALGGVLIDTRIKCPVLIEDNRGVWGDPDRTVPLQSVLAPEIGPGTDPHCGRVAVFVEMRQRANHLFDGFLAGLSTPIAGSLKLKRTGPEWVLPGEGLPFADAAAKAVRDFADLHDAHEILLCGTLSFPVSVLLGRRLNTFAVVAYDLAQHVETEANGNKRYLARWYRRVLELGASDGQISAVHTDPVPAIAPVEFR